MSKGPAWSTAMGQQQPHCPPVDYQQFMPKACRYQCSATLPILGPGVLPKALSSAGREELFEEMMGERDDVAAKRTSCQAAVAALRQAMAAVDSVPQTLLSRINSPHR